MSLPLISGDRSHFRTVNGFARDTAWLHGFMIFMAKDGIALFAIALLVGWWIARRQRSPRKVAIAVWGALAALIAVALVQPIASAADEQRPFVGHPGVLKLIPHAADTGFPSDHATAAGAIAAALFFISWQLGLISALLAAIVAFSRVYVGVHFPQDVVAGLALGAVVAVLGVFVIVPILARIAELLTRTRLRPLVVSGPGRVELSRS